MTDEIQQLEQDIANKECWLLSHFNESNPGHNYIKVSINQYGLQYDPNQVIQQVNNYVNDHGKSISDDNKKQINDYINEIQGDQSQIDVDRRDNKKNITHIAHKTLPIIQNVLNNYNLSTNDKNKLANFIKTQQYVNALSSKFSKNPKSYTNNVDMPRLLHVLHGALNQSNYNYNINKKDADTFESPQNSWNMISNLLPYLDYQNKCQDFMNKYGKNKPGYQPYEYRGKMFYFPQNMTANAQWDYLEGLINDYYSDINKRNTYDRLTNNEYHAMYHSLYNNNFKTAEGTSDNRLPDENNHPINNIPAQQGMANAMTNYQYKIQKNRVWEQYYQDKINQMNSLSKILNGKYTTELNKAVQGGFTYKARPGTTYGALAVRYGIPVNEIEDANPGVNAYHIPIGYRIKLPSKKGAKYLRNGDSILNGLSQNSRQYNELIKLRDRWKQRADSLQNNWQSELNTARSEEYYTATIDNIHSDPRNGHFAYIRPVNPDTEDSYVFMMVTDESPTHSTNASSNPIEWGRNVTAGTQMQPTSVNLSGYLFNDNLPQSAEDGHASQEPNNGHGLDPVKQDDENIAEWADGGAEVFYSGIHMFPHCTITSWNPDYNTGSDGSLTSCSFSMTLQLNMYFQSNALPAKNGKSQDKGGKKRSRGKLSTKPRNRIYRVKAGQNLSTIALHCHVPLSKLERANHRSIKDYNLIYPGQRLTIPR